MKKKILHIVGNRPQFIKLGAFLAATKERGGIKDIVVHSGQHYDFDMSKIFFRQLDIPEPDYNLGAGSGTPGVQTAKMLAPLDPVLIKERPNIVVVYGDTTTTLAGALAGYKLHIPVAHVESGMREHIWRPEEINKKMADHCSDLCFCPTRTACQNLEDEGIDRANVIFTGDITYDAFLAHRRIAMEKCLSSGNDYVLVTMHRAETVDVYEKIRGVVDALIKLPLRVIYPVHPRTKKQLVKFRLYDKLARSPNVDLRKPVGYFEFLRLLSDARLVMTDSSGVIKETFYAGKLGVTLDDTSEYERQIFDGGHNVLAGTETQNILKHTRKMLKRTFPSIPSRNQPFGDGHAARKMVDCILKRF